MRKFCQEMNTDAGMTFNLMRRKTDIIGKDMKDPFFDSFEQEGLECSDILRLMEDCSEKVVTISFHKIFLKKLVHSHLLWIKEMEKFNTCQLR